MLRDVVCLLCISRAGFESCVRNPCIYQVCRRHGISIDNSFMDEWSTKTMKDCGAGMVFA